MQTVPTAGHTDLRWILKHMSTCDPPVTGEIYQTRWIFDPAPTCLTRPKEQNTHGGFHQTHGAYRVYQPRNKQVTADSTLINPILVTSSCKHHPAGTQPRQGFIGIPGFERAKGQLTAAATVQMASSAALWVSSCMSWSLDLFDLGAAPLPTAGLCLPWCFLLSNLPSPRFRSAVPYSAPTLHLEMIWETTR